VCEVYHDVLAAITKSKKRCSTNKQV